MFQPAGVRTLLQMRSSAPLRPPTGRTRRLRTADPSTMVGRRVGTANPADCRKPFRPLTAPAASGGVDLAILSNQAQPLVEEGNEEEDEGEEQESGDDFAEDLQDPSVLNAQASAEIYHLQHNWLQERQDEVGQLWEKLEQQYGFKLPDSHPARQLQDFRKMSEAGLPSSWEEDVDLQDQAMESPQDDGSKARADSILGQAKSDLEGAHNFRQQMEQRICRASEDAHASSSRSGSAVASIVVENARMSELRKEVDLLRQRQYAWCEEERVEDKMQAATASEHPVSDNVPDDMSKALNQWADNLRLLGAIGDARASSDLPSVEGSGLTSRTVENLPSSQRRRPAAQDVSAEAAHVVAPEARRADAEDATLPSPTAVDDAAAMMERQLDELLGEMDEFDRIHGDLYKLTCS